MAGLNPRPIVVLGGAESKKLDSTRCGRPWGLATPIVKLPRYGNSLEEYIHTGQSETRAVVPELLAKRYFAKTIDLLSAVPAASTR